jgi:hypothetical protein
MPHVIGSSCGTSHSAPCMRAKTKVLPIKTYAHSTAHTRPRAHMTTYISWYATSPLRHRSAFGKIIREFGHRSKTGRGSTGADGAPSSAPLATPYGLGGSAPCLGGAEFLEAGLTGGSISSARVASASALRASAPPCRSERADAAATCPIRGRRRRRSRCPP